VRGEGASLLEGGECNELHDLFRALVLFHKNKRLGVGVF
jgi:hypothetical protein